MKSLKNILIYTILISISPSLANANIELQSGAEARIRTPSENRLDLRKLDLQKKLFREEVDERRNEFQEAREAFKNSTSDTRNIMRSEFRAKFAERFKFTLDKLSEFQTRADARLQTEANLGVDISKAKVKLEESKSFYAQINTDIESLKSLLEERYAEDERETKKEEARILIEKIKTGIKSSHEALKEVFQELRLAKSQSQETEVSTEVNIGSN